MNPRREPLLTTMEQWQMLREQAAVFLKSGFLPAAIKTPEAAITIMLKGLELNVPPLHALANIAVVNGKPVAQAELILALILRDHAPNVPIQVVETTDQQAVVWHHRPGGKEGTLAFTIDDARKAGLLTKTGPWQQYPKAMLRARAISATARMIFPDSIGGMYTPEELGANVRVTQDGEIEVVETVVSDGPSLALPAHSTVVDATFAMPERSPEPVPIRRAAPSAPAAPPRSARDLVQEQAPEPSAPAVPLNGYPSVVERLADDLENATTVDEYKAATRLCSQARQSGQLAPAAYTYLVAVAKTTQARIKAQSEPPAPPEPPAFVSSLAPNIDELFPEE